MQIESEVGRFYSAEQVAALLGVCRQTIYIWERKGTFPPRIRLSPGRVVWSREVVERFIVERTMEAEKRAAATS